MIQDKKSSDFYKRVLPFFKAIVAVVALETGVVLIVTHPWGAMGCVVFCTGLKLLSNALDGVET